MTLSILRSITLRSGVIGSAAGALIMGLLSFSPVQASAATELPSEYTRRPATGRETAPDEYRSIKVEMRNGTTYLVALNRAVTFAYNPDGGLSILSENGEFGFDPGTVKHFSFSDHAGHIPASPYEPYRPDTSRPDFRSIEVHQTDGSTLHIAVEPAMIFEYLPDGTLNIAYADAELTFAPGSVRQFTFCDAPGINYMPPQTPEGIEDVAADSDKALYDMSYDGREVIIRSSDGSAINAALYSLNGTKTGDYTGSHIIIPVSGLTPGVYILSAGDSTFKILVK